MPKLVMLAPCQKAIISSQDNSVSMISLLESLGIEVEAGKTIPQGSIAPFSWDILSVWMKEQGDEEKAFRQKVTLVMPDGREIDQAEVNFDMSNDWVRNVIHVDGFPIDAAGQGIVRLSLTNDAEDAVWRTVAEHPFVINHIPPTS